MKKSLRAAILDGIKSHLKSCPGEELIPIGRIEDFFDDTEEADMPCPYWVQDGIVYLTVECPKRPHETLKEHLSQAIGAALDAWTVRNGYNLRSSFIFTGSSKIKGLVNVLGCGTEINKEPDFGFSLGPSFTPQYQRFPFLESEMASRHESLHLLMCEAGTWMNLHTEVRYVLVAKIWPDWRLSIYLCEKDEEAAEQVMLAKQQGQLCQKERAPVPVSLEDLEKKYGLKVLFHFELPGWIAEDDSLIIRLDLASVLANVGFHDPGLVERVLEIDIALAISRFYIFLRQWIEAGQPE